MELSEIVGWRKGLDYSRDVPAIDILQKCFDSLINMIMEERANYDRLRCKSMRRITEPCRHNDNKHEVQALCELGLEGVWPLKED